MARRCVKLLLLGCSSLGALVAASAAANAGGFALREQSAYGQGASFAGVAAGGALSSMYWNPAVVTQYAGKTVEQDLAAIVPRASHSFSTATLSALGAGPSDSGDDALVPAGYTSWQFNDRLWLAMSVNAPFGLGVSFPRNWAGAAYGQNAKLESYNFAPTIAYKISDWISVAVGLQAQYMKVSYDAWLGTAPLIASITGAGWSAGFTAGVTLTPLPQTQIGIGYRSALNQHINGTMDVPAGVAGSTRGSVNLNLNLPDMLTVGLRQGIGDRFTLLAGFEWANWSRIGTARLYQPSGAAATIGGAAVTFPFEYSDGWFYSLGGEYAVNPAVTVRAGIGFEKSPITDGVRTPRLPDNDRTWYSAGFSYKPAIARGVTFDFGYSYIDVKETPLRLGPGTGNPWSGSTTYTGSTTSSIHIASVALRYQWDDTPPPAKKMLVTK